MFIILCVLLTSMVWHHIGTQKISHGYFPMGGPRRMWFWMLSYFVLLGSFLWYNSTSRRYGCDGFAFVWHEEDDHDHAPPSTRKEGMRRECMCA